MRLPRSISSRTLLLLNNISSIHHSTLTVPDPISAQTSDRLPLAHRPITGLVGAVKEVLDAAKIVLAVR